MNLVPGMKLKSADHTGVVVSVKPNCFHIDIPEYGDIQRITKEYYTQWQPTGEVDWSLVPDGTPIEWFYKGWNPGIKQGSRGEYVIIERDMRKFNHGWDEIVHDKKHVRIPQPPVRHKEKFWVNIYKDSIIHSYLHKEKEEADSVRLEGSAVACKEIEIEWEEGEGL